jgi:putative peptidoglycan lipid II flippase
MLVLCTTARQGEASLNLAQNIEQPYSKTASLGGAAWTVGTATAISRILGVLREIVLARYFGAGLYSDAFNVAYRIPNFLRDLFAEGALSSAFIPTFIRCLTKEGQRRAWQLANRVISALLLILGGVTLILFFGAKIFVYLIAAGYAQIPEKFALTVQMTRIMSPFLLFIALASVGMGILNACGSFFVPAMASSAFNICCILSGIFLSPLMPHWGLPPVVSMAIGALIGGASQFIVMIPPAHGMGFRFRFSPDFSDPALRHIARLMLPAVVGLSATQINITVDYQLASRYGNGPVSWLNYGFRLMQFPVGVLGIGIATATLTTVSLYAARNALKPLHETVSSSLRLAACLTFPATVGLIVFRREIVQLIYEHGSFLAKDTIQTSQVVLFYALGLASYSAAKILVPSFYALEDTRTPVRLSILSISAKIALNFILVIPMGFLGLALATTLASWLNCGLLLRELRERAVGMWPAGEIRIYFRIFVASMIMGLFSWSVFLSAMAIAPGSGFFSLSLRLGLAILAGIAAWIPLLRLFRIEEGLAIAQKIGALLKRAL